MLTEEDHTLNLSGSDLGPRFRVPDLLRSVERVHAAGLHTNTAAAQVH